MTDSEVAQRIAAALDLVAVVEPTLEVTPILERRGDPLHFLRRLADARGAELAITRGRLFFAPEVAPLAHVVFSPSAGGHGESFAGDPAELSIERVLGARSVGRRGRLTVWGNASLRPLTSCTLAEVDATVDGLYRVVRCHHRMRATTYSTEVRFIEHGWNLACHGKGERA